MLADLETYDLSELSAAAGVTPRTIRYYVQQGLLPSPGTRGPGTRYDRAHLDRLQLIRRLQREHLPLAEIRRRLDALGDDGVREALSTSPEPPARASALDYVRDLLARQSARTSSASTTKPGAPPPPPLAASAAMALHSGLAAEPTQALSQRPSRSTWDRIPLAPDVELHIRRPLSREQNRQVERLIEAARDLFAEEP
ncbi:MAG: MerR family transcriptional regulator [Gemmatimonadota bacterium]|nr:MerR family transcriptional regulator [Gemmatimonadota bacterium]